MKLQKASRKELLHIAVGTLIGCIIMDVIFALTRHFDTSVIYGTLLGYGFTVLNFYLMCVCIQNAVQRGKGAKSYIQYTYILRMFLIAAVLVVGFAVKWFNGIAAAIPFLMPRLTIYAMQLLGLYKPEKPAENQAGKEEEHGD